MHRYRDCISAYSPFRDGRSQINVNEAGERGRGDRGRRMSCVPPCVPRISQSGMGDWAWTVELSIRSHPPTHRVGVNAVIESFMDTGNCLAGNRVTHALPNVLMTSVTTCMIRACVSDTVSRIRISPAKEATIPDECTMCCSDEVMSFVSDYCLRCQTASPVVTCQELNIH
jgi:hypothetical protein